MSDVTDPGKAAVVVFTLVGTPGQVGRLLAQFEEFLRTVVPAQDATS